jgi:hypothetical protein
MRSQPGWGVAAAEKSEVSHDYDVEDYEKKLRASKDTIDFSGKLLKRSDLINSILTDQCTNFT